VTGAEADYQARVAVARKFAIPLWVVDVNHICLEREVEYFHFYFE